MDCPDCNVKLKRKQTFDRSAYVERINGCPQCGKRFNSKEYLDSWFSEKDNAFNDSLRSLRVKQREIEGKYEQLVSALRVIRTAIDV